MAGVIAIDWSSNKNFLYRKIPLAGRYGLDHGRGSEIGKAVRAVIVLVRHGVRRESLLYDNPFPWRFLSLPDVSFVLGDRT